jgi:hypothetical protein
MKHKNWFWQLFLMAIGAIVLWYTGSAAYGLYQYHRLNREMQAHSVQWAVKKEADDAYFLIAKYQFSPLQNSLVEGETIFKFPIFWNAWAAEKAIPEYAAKSWLVYYVGNNPSISSLQKNFPLKECISATVLWGILIYFLWLDRYISKWEN